MKWPGMPGTVMIFPWGICWGAAGVPADTGVGLAIPFPPPSECPGTPILWQAWASSDSGEGLGAVLVRPAAPVCTTFISQSGNDPLCGARCQLHSSPHTVGKSQGWWRHPQNFTIAIPVYFSLTYLENAWNQFLITFMSRTVYHCLPTCS